MKITYENNIGTIELFGSGRHDFNLCSVSGLDLPEKNRMVKSYINEDGCVEDTSQYMQRIITVSGDLYSENGFSEKLRKAIRVLSEKGRLIVENENSIRIINVDSASLTTGNKYNSYMTFVIQLICDYPHFNDGITNKVDLFAKKNLISCNTILPAVFSKRISKGIIDNRGDTNIYPVIVIKKENNDATSNNILIENLSTGARLIIEKEIQKNEVIKIDVKNRTITSNISGNILGTLDIYTSLAGFYCKKNENVINISLNGKQEGIAVYVLYCNEYMEAI